MLSMGEIMGMPFYIIIGVWICLLVVTLFVMKFMKGGEDLIQVRDKCPATQPNYQYLIQLCFEEYHHFSVKTTIHFCVYNQSKRLMTRFIASPKVFRNHSYYISEDKKVMRFLLNRKNLMKGMAYVSISHNSSKGYLLVNSFEMKNIKSEHIFNAKVDAKIYPIGLKMAYKTFIECQMYGLKNIGTISFISKTLPLPILRPFEYMIFVFLAMNTIPLLCLFLMFCKKSDSSKSCQLSNDIDFLILDAFLSSVITFGIVFGAVFVYFLILRYHHLRTVYTKWWLFVKTAYMSVIVTIGLVLGTIVIFNKKIKGNNHSEEFYAICIFTAYGIALLVVFPVFLSLIFGWKYCFRVKDTEYFSDFLRRNSKKIPSSGTSSIPTSGLSSSSFKRTNTTTPTSTI